MTTQISPNTLIVLAKKHSDKQIRKIAGEQLIEEYLKYKENPYSLPFSLDGISQSNEYLPEIRQVAGEHHINHLVEKGYYDSLQSIIEARQHYDKFPKKIQERAKQYFEAAAMSAIELIVKNPQDRNAHSLEGIARDSKAPTSARILAGKHMIQEHTQKGEYGSLSYMVQNEVITDNYGKERGTYPPEVVQKAKESIPKAAMNAYQQYTTKYASDNADRLYALATSEICPLEIRTLAGIHLINNKYAYDCNGLDYLAQNEKFPQDIRNLAVSKVATELERAGKILLEEQRKIKMKHKNKK